MDGVVGKPTERCERSRWGPKALKRTVIGLEVEGRSLTSDQQSCGWFLDSGMGKEMTGKEVTTKQRAVSAISPTTPAQLTHRALCSTRIFLNLVTFQDKGRKFFGSIWNYLTNNAVSHQKTLVFICTALRTSNPICLMSVCVFLQGGWYCIVSGYGPKEHNVAH